MNSLNNSSDMNSNNLWWSPEGTIVRSRIAKPVFKHNAEFAECNLELSQDVGNTFINAMHDYICNIFDDLKNNPSNSNDHILKFPYDIVDEKYIFLFDSCTNCRINGNDYVQDIIVTNSVGHTVDSYINNGSKAKIKFSIVPYRYRSYFGVYLKLIAVNILNDNKHDFIMIES
ncbi:MAG: hypothetical protein ABW127_09905 [Candidatus Thiodiazotropha endolucinida]